ncbi:MAG TPA: undecaprenyldiphospho-muramoylpentapeptide beta-N-acetylglucosaminyltransferase [bacterium]|nr:undecaprenyldiphospho-muramoylpentapeptide beta-N-acetylglucosaminyltransferase [bacterium]HOL48767.1 undecaprenyldiphospho-muramoylpentapeptide beta-N-acetylglucosaminyltransferase [bacterium]HPQ18009.1 undecaprenyldiphospho-muramoylpentapeptide beta-N-acetylglucosaminyltransferase [bacterium]
MRIFISGGGTGGHIYPAIAIIENILVIDKKAEIFYIGNKKSLEEKIVQQSNLPVKFLYLKTAGFFNKSLIDKFLSIIYLMKSILNVIRLFIIYNPDFVIGTGGYVIVPVIIGSIIFRKPFFLQEQNIIPGWTNYFFSSFAKFLFLGFNETKIFFKKKNKLFYTGNPIRMEFFEYTKQEEKDYQKVIIMGGSGGAASINNLIPDVVNEFKNYEKIKFIHITGIRDFERILDKSDKSNNNYQIYPYLNKIWLEFKDTDLIICRAGAITITEIAYLKIPMILIPFPAAVKNHQYWNAYKFYKLGIADIILDKELTKENLVEKIKEYILNKEKIAEVKRNFEKIKIENSGQIIVNKIYSIIKK